MLCHCQKSPAMPGSHLCWACREAVLSDLNAHYRHDCSGNAAASHKDRRTGRPQLNGAPTVGEANQVYSANRYHAPPSVRYRADMVRRGILRDAKKGKR